MQAGAPLRTYQAGGDVDDGPPQCRSAGYGMGGVGHGALDCGVAGHDQGNCATWRTQAPTTARVSHAQSPRTRIGPCAPAARAVLIAWAIIGPALCLTRPARPEAHLGDHRGDCAVLIVVASGDRPLGSTCVPAILLCP